ncbi:MAG: PCRF domain-containing protein, partial [Methylococcales bacterium]|nr:PCRF domain-containing protein [Methylococcales bacterium]
MQEINPIKNTIVDLRKRGSDLKDYLDFTTKSERLVEVLRELEEPEVWNDPARAKALGKERGLLVVVVDTINALEQGLEDAEELLEMA